MKLTQVIGQEQFLFEDENEEYRVIIRVCKKEGFYLYFYDGVETSTNIVNYYDLVKLIGEENVRNIPRR